MKIQVKEFECSKCGFKLQVPIVIPARAGQKIQCPKCKNTLAETKIVKPTYDVNQEELKEDE